MNSIFSEKVISLRELALFLFAALLIAAAPARTFITDVEQPVEVSVPVEPTPTEVNSA